MNDRDLRASKRRAMGNLPPGPSEQRWRRCLKRPRKLQDYRHVTPDHKVCLGVLYLLLRSTGAAH